MNSQKTQLYKSLCTCHSMSPFKLPSLFIQFNSHHDRPLPSSLARRKNVLIIISEGLKNDHLYFALLSSSDFDDGGYLLSSIAKIPAEGRTKTLRFRIYAQLEVAKISKQAILCPRIQRKKRSSQSQKSR